MLATSERVSPCRARCSARSVGRVTRHSSPSMRTSMSRDLRSSRSPRGPATRTTSGSTVIVTPDGTGMGFFPIRLMRLPDLGEYLAADARGTGVVAGHHAVGGGQDRGAHAAEDLRDVRGVHVRAAAGARDPLQAGDHRDARLGVLELDHEGLARAVGAGLVGADVALLLEE